jgi:putative ADP-ribosylglycohydrolase
MENIDKYRGCLLGGAAGDALGYAIEFDREEAIAARYGSRGIRDYQLDERGLAPFSDDTQMTLYTANSLLYSLAALSAQAYGDTQASGGAPTSSDAQASSGAPAPAPAPLPSPAALAAYAPAQMAQFYVEWMYTQVSPYPLAEPKAWISSLPELFASRAPGVTCMNACEAMANGAKAVNNSKGCGGIMRMAPVGLINTCPSFSGVELQRLGAQLAELTHCHELGWMPAGVFAHIVSLLSRDEASSVREAATQALNTLPEAFPNAHYLGQLQELLRYTLRLADSDIPDLEAIHALGEGWVAEEALAIGLLCSLRHENDFAGAITSAVNHGGDSDSTGAIAGNIVGAHLGLTEIPQRYLEHLELRDTISKIADDLFTGPQASPDLYFPSASPDGDGVQPQQVSTTAPGVTTQLERRRR